MATSDSMAAGWAGHVHEYLSEYLDGGLSAAERAEVEAHLAGCPRCRADLASLRLTVQLVRQLPLQPVPRSFALAVPRRTPAIVTWLRFSTGALAAIFVALLAIQLTAAPGRSPTAAPRSAAIRSQGQAQSPSQSGPQAQSQSGPQSPSQPQSAAARDSAAPAAAPGVGAAPPAASSALSRAANQATPAPAELTPGGRPQVVRAVALAPTPTAYPIPATMPTVVPMTPAGSSYPYPNAAQPPVVAPTYNPYPNGTPPPEAPAINPSGPARPPGAPTETPGAPMTLTGGPNWLTPGIVLVAVLLVLSGALLLLLSRRR